MKIVVSDQSLSIEIPQRLQVFEPIRVQMLEQAQAVMQALENADYKDPQTVAAVKRARLDLRKFRTEAEKAKKAGKAAILEEGKAWDSVYNTLKAFSEEWEKKALELETREQREKEAAIEAERQKRQKQIDELGGTDLPLSDLGTMEQAEFDRVLHYIKEAKAKAEAEAKAKAEAEAAARAEAEAKAALAKERARLFSPYQFQGYIDAEALADMSDAEFTLIVAKAKAEAEAKAEAAREAARVQAEKAKAEAEARAKMEAEAAAKAAEERAARMVAEAAAKAKAEAEAKAAREKAEAAAKEAARIEALAESGDNEKIAAFAARIAEFMQLPENSLTPKSSKGKKKMEEAKRLIREAYKVLIS